MLATLRANIEALATEVRQTTAYTNTYGDEHVVICNGVIKREGESPAPWPGLHEACAKTLRIAETLSAHHRGDQVVLFWRVTPQVAQAPDGDMAIYTRLSFAVNPPAAEESRA